MAGASTVDASWPDPTQVDPECTVRPAPSGDLAWAETLTAMTGDAATTELDAAVTAAIPRSAAGMVGLAGGAAARAQHPAAPRYVLQRLLGRGGMGAVFAAEQASLGREVALKLLRDDQRSIGSRAFRSEAVVTAGVAHPNVVPVHDAGEDYLALKIVRGQTLATWLGNGPVSSERLPETVEILIKVCEALALAHARGVVHRDVKPANIMVGAFGEVLLMDWGLAVAAAGAAGSPAPPLTRANACAGTPAYLAPEMATGDLTAIGAASDVFLVGGVLYRVLTGTSPYAGGDRAGVLVRAAACAYPPVPGSAPARLVELQQRCMVRRPEQRCGLEELIAGLRRWLRSVDDERAAREAFAAARAAAAWATGVGAMAALFEALHQSERACALWPEWDEACVGRDAIAERYALSAVAAGDLALGRDLLAQLPASARVRVEQALATAVAARRRRRWMTIALRGAAAALVVLAIGALATVAHRRATRRERERAGLQADAQALVAGTATPSQVLAGPDPASGFAVALMRLWRARGLAPDAPAVRDRLAATLAAQGRWAADGQQLGLLRASERDLAELAPAHPVVRELRAVLAAADAHRQRLIASRRERLLAVWNDSALRDSSGWLERLVEEVSAWDGPETLGLLDVLPDDPSDELAAMLFCRVALRRPDLASGARLRGLAFDPAHGPVLRDDAFRALVARAQRHPGERPGLIAAVAAAGAAARPGWGQRLCREFPAATSAAVAEEWAVGRRLGAVEAMRTVARDRAGSWPPAVRDARLIDLAAMLWFHRRDRAGARALLSAVADGPERAWLASLMCWEHHEPLPAAEGDARCTILRLFARAERGEPPAQFELDAVAAEAAAPLPAWRAHLFRRCGLEDRAEVLGLAVHRHRSAVDAALRLADDGAVDVARAVLAELERSYPGLVDVARARARCEQLAGRPVAALREAVRATRLASDRIDAMLALAEAQLALDDPAGVFATLAQLETRRGHRAFLLHGDHGRSLRRRLIAWTRRHGHDRTFYRLIGRERDRIDLLVRALLEDGRPDIAAHELLLRSHDKSRWDAPVGAWRYYRQAVDELLFWIAPLRERGWPGCSGERLHRRAVDECLVLLMRAMPSARRRARMQALLDVGGTTEDSVSARWAEVVRALCAGKRAQARAALAGLQRDPGPAADWTALQRRALARWLAHCEQEAHPLLPLPVVTGVPGAVPRRPVADYRPDLATLVRLRLFWREVIATLQPLPRLDDPRPVIVARRAWATGPDGAARRTALDAVALAPRAAGEGDLQSFVADLPAGLALPPAALRVLDWLARGGR